MERKELDKISDAMVQSLKLMIDKQTYTTGQVTSVLMVLADRTKVPPEIQDHEDKFFKALTRFGVDRALLKTMPYPVLAMLPEDKSMWSNFIEHVAEDTNATMYAVITEATGASKKLVKEYGDMKSIHPDNKSDYALIRVGMNGYKGRSFAAPIRYSIVDRQGNRERRVGEWKEQTGEYKLPLNWEGEQNAG